MGNLATPKSVQKLQTALHAKAKAEAGLSLLRSVRQSMDASRRKMIPLVSTAWMHESIRPVDGAVRAPGLDGIRCFWPHKIIGRAGLVVHQA